MVRKRKKSNRNIWILVVVTFLLVGVGIWFSFTSFEGEVVGQAIGVNIDQKLAIDVAGNLQSNKFESYYICVDTKKVFDSFEKQLPSISSTKNCDINAGLDTNTNKWIIEKDPQVLQEINSGQTDLVKQYSKIPWYYIKNVETGQYLCVVDDSAFLMMCDMKKTMVGDSIQAIKFTTAVEKGVKGAKGKWFVKPLSDGSFTFQSENDKYLSSLYSIDKSPLVTEESPTFSKEWLFTPACKEGEIKKNDILCSAGLLYNCILDGFVQTVGNSKSDVVCESIGNDDYWIECNTNELQETTGGIGPSVGGVLAYDDTVLCAMAGDENIPSPSEIKTSSGLCLGIQPYTPVSGSDTVLWKCENLEKQLWLHDPITKQIIGQNNLCLTMKWIENQANPIVKVESCKLGGDLSSQQWDYNKEKGTLKVDDKICLHIDKEELGQKPTLTSCSSSSQWDFENKREQWLKCTNQDAFSQHTTNGKDYVCYDQKWQSCTYKTLLGGSESTHLCEPSEGWLVCSPNAIQKYENKKQGIFTQANYGYPENKIVKEGTEKGDFTCTKSGWSSSANLIAEYKFETLEPYVDDVNTKAVLDEKKKYDGFGKQKLTIDSGVSKDTKAAKFLGNVDSIFTLPKELLDKKESFSISFWTKTTDTYGGYLSVANQQQANHFLVWLNGKSELTIYFNGEVQSFNFAPHTISDDKWHHIAIVREKGTVKAYLDGANVQTKEYQYSASLNVDEILVGNDLDAEKAGDYKYSSKPYTINKDEGFTGLIDEMRFFTGVRTGQDIDFEIKNTNIYASEICNDNIDNNQDGKTDCNDISCFNHVSCLSKVKLLANFGFEDGSNLGKNTAPGYPPQPDAIVKEVKQGEGFINSKGGIFSKPSSFTTKVFDGEQDVTVTSWFKTTSNVPTSIFAVENGAGIDFALTFEKNNAYVELKGNLQQITLPYSVTEGKWHKFYLYRNRRFGEFYLDGKKIADLDSGPNANGVFSSNREAVGQSFTKTGSKIQSFVGNVDLFQVWRGKVKEEIITTSSTFPELCEDGKDNDGNGETDCLDTQCVFEQECTGTIPTIAHYKFETLDNNVVVDETGKFNGESTRNDLLAQGHDGKGLQLEQGKEEYARIPKEVLDGNQIAKIEMKFKTTSKETAIFNAAGDNSPDELIAWVDSNGFLEIRFHGELWKIPTTRWVNDNKWHTLSILIAGEHMKVLIDGNEFIHQFKESTPLDVNMLLFGQDIDIDKGNQKVIEEIGGKSYTFDRAKAFGGVLDSAVFGVKKVTCQVDKGCPAGLVCYQKQCVDPSIKPTSEKCNDGIDNDQDGKTDCEDSDCVLETNKEGLTCCFSGKGEAVDSQICKAPLSCMAGVCSEDTDKDGVSNQKDNCPLIPNGKDLGYCSDDNSEECTDDDFDGSCGSCIMNQPDSDGDGFGDICDKCPNEKGDKEGCPVTPGGDGTESNPFKIKCGFSDWVKDKYYTLDGDQTSKGTCLQINKAVILDCKNQKITGDGTGLGINVAWNAKVENCVIDKFDRGISVTDDEAIIKSNKVSGSSTGMYIEIQDDGSTLELSGNEVCDNTNDLRCLGGAATFKFTSKNKFENVFGNLGCNNLDAWKNAGGYGSCIAVDSDGDGVLDPFDACPNTPKGLQVYQCQEDNKLISTLYKCSNKAYDFAGCLKGDIRPFVALSKHDGKINGNDDTRWVGLLRTYQKNPSKQINEADMDQDGDVDGNDDTKWVGRLRDFQKHNSK